MNGTVPMPQRDISAVLMHQKEMRVVVQVILCQVPLVSSTTYDDYTYYDIEAWQRYVDGYADEWLTYPNFSGKSRKINGYDFSAFNNYQENGSTSSFAFGTASFHYWWFNHIPHNPGVSDGKLNNWWPYIYDFNRFDGSAIQYPVDGFPVVPTTYSTTNNEYGTEEGGMDTTGCFGIPTQISDKGQMCQL